MITHNQYCREDWIMYRGFGPRGMGPNNDGCVCDLAPDGYPDEVATGEEQAINFESYGVSGYEL